MSFDRSLAERYRSRAQRARRLTEGWFAANMYCAVCGEDALQQNANNSRTADFCCASCAARFELKGASRPHGATVPDGAFGTMMERLEGQGGGPHLALLRYCAEALSVRELTIVAAPFLTKDVILPRPPLGPHARRAGWIGCNIRIADVPAAGRIVVVQDGMPLPRSEVTRSVRRAASVSGDISARTWLVDALRCVERLGREFVVAEVYAFEAELQKRHPGNQHIRPKLRQQLPWKIHEAGWTARTAGG